MSSQGFWICDPDTKEDRYILYSDLEEETLQAFIRPLGGFIFPANLFLRAKLPPVPFYIKDWLPKRGKSVLYAPAKSGKSYLCLQIAACVGAGTPFLGMPTTKGSVLYVQFELGESILQRRMRDETKLDYDNVFVGTHFNLKLDTKIGQDQLWRALEAVEPNVLILDPKIKMIAGNEDKSVEMRPVCDYLDLVIDGFACSIFITDHSGKDVSKRGRGSSIFEDWVDSYISMKRVSKKGEPLRVQITPIFFRHASLPKEPIEAELGEDFQFHLVASTPTIKQLIEEFIKECSESVLPRDLFEAKIGSNTSVYDALRELVEEGKVEKEGRGRYRWIFSATTA